MAKKIIISESQIKQALFEIGEFKVDPNIEITIDHITPTFYGAHFDIGEYQIYVSGEYDPSSLLIDFDFSYNDASTMANFKKKTNDIENLFKKMGAIIKIAKDVNDHFFDLHKLNVHGFKYTSDDKRLQFYDFVLSKVEPTWEKIINKNNPKEVAIVEDNYAWKHDLEQLLYRYSNNKNDSNNRLDPEYTTDWLNS